MRWTGVMTAGAAGLLASAPALPQDRDACETGLVCASDPARVMAAMEKAGLKPKLSTDNQGDPIIESEEAPYHFDVYFYGCENHRNCDSLRFQVEFSKDPSSTVALANKWNVDHRFLQAALKDDGRLIVAYDVATIGGVNQRNFADVLDWWVSMLGVLGEFFQKEVPAPAKTGKTS